MITSRYLAIAFKKALKTFPAVVITGPRQSGKTTFLRSYFPNQGSYSNMEEPDVALIARQDPRGFLSNLSKPAIIDEIQYVPELFPYIKSLIDADRQPASWILSGSQNFALMAKVTESLAGRAAILSLLPFMVGELQGKANTMTPISNLLSMAIPKIKPSSALRLEDCLYRGFFPEIALSTKVDRNTWCGSYVTTYLERDIRNLKQIGDLTVFQTFLRSCAVRTSTILDLSSISREVGISMPTAKRWLSMLIAGYQVMLLPPYFKNIGKRLIKRPKLYFLDTGLASYLMGYSEAKPLMVSPYLGPLFETMIVTDIYKRFLSCGQYPPMYFFRSRDGLEVDLVIEQNGKLNLIEIKSGATITSSHVTSLLRLKRELGELIDKTLVISNTDQSFSLGNGVNNYSWKNWLAS